MPLNSEHTSLATLPEGSIVGTSSVRRSAQLLHKYPQLKFKSIRGNLKTRLGKLDDPSNGYACIILAAAGLHRLNMQDRITHYLSKDEMMYAVGQGAIGIEIKKGDTTMQQLCQVLGCKETTWRCIAERALLRTLEGGCSVPVGVWTEVVGDEVRMEAKVLSIDGTQVVDAELSGRISVNQDAVTLGIDLANLMIAKGARKILDEINFENINEVKNSGIVE